MPFPDAEAIAIKHLRTDQTVATNRVYGQVPASPTFPLLTLHRFGGAPSVKDRLDVAMVQVDAWAETKEEARYLAAQARDSLGRLEGQRVSVTMAGSVEVGGFVTNVSDLIGLTWLPDPDTNRPRYLFQVAISLHN